MIKALTTGYAVKTANTTNATAINAYPQPESPLIFRLFNGLANWAIMRNPFQYAMS